MIETPIDAVAVAEPNQNERLTQMITAMKEEYITKFPLNDVFIERNGDSIVIRNRWTSEELGGRFLINSGTVESVVEWVQMKVDHYEVNQ